MASIQTFPTDAQTQRGWEVAAIERKGRGVVSTAPIPAGHAVLTEPRPLVAVVHASRTLQACATCMGLRLGEVSTKFLPQPLQCAGCGQVCWCSEECRNHSQVAQAHPVQLCFAYGRLAEMVAAASKRAKEDGRTAATQPPSSPASGPDAAAREAALLDDESLSDARLLFAAYYFRRYRADDFARWSELCALPDQPVVHKHTDHAAATSASASASAASASAPSSSTATAGSSSKREAMSAAMAENEARIEAIHDIVVECLQYAADCLAQPTPASVSPQEAAAGNGAASASAHPQPSADVAAAAAPTPAASVATAATPSPSLLPPPPLSLPKMFKQFTDLHISHPSDDMTSSLASDADLSVSRSMLLKAQCNAMALSAPHDKLGNRQTPRGYAIYAAAAMFNHSCMPNVARFDHIDARDVKFTRGGKVQPVAVAPTAAASASASNAGASGAAASATPASGFTPSPTDPASLLAPSPSDCASSSSFTPLALELRALHAIPPYTELCISYVPLFWDRRARREQLEEEFGFICRCVRCRAEKALEREERLLREANGEDDEEDEEEHDHDHGDEDEDEEDGEDDDDDEDEEEEPLSDDDSDDGNGDAELPSRGELNIFCTKYICPSKTCGGTMAPLREGSPSALAAPPVIAGPAGKALGGHMECNTCAKMRTDAQFQRQLQKEFGARK